MNVYIGKPVVISDMQGPCDSGSHVPTADERETLYNVGQTLGIWSSSNGTNIKNYLKMPYAGRRLTNDSVNNQGSAGYYWSCIAYYNSGDSTYYGYDMSFGNTYVYYKDTNYGAKSIGMSIRPFKDTPVVPDSSWTVVYQGTGDAGVFHNTTLGLISISSDGTTWITIADKNLGATTVYNNGDTLSEANCGKYYQRGNNYGFAWTGATTTSSTQVNASTYGPGNYYNSNTFITANPRDSSNNSNLRGGVSQGTSTKDVELKNAYIGEYVPPYLCLTSEQANSTVRLSKVGSPTSITLETSTDGNTWNTYTFGDTITLTNIGDKVYWRNTSETITLFSKSFSNNYKFVMTGSISASGDVNFLLCKYSTTILPSSVLLYYNLFSGCTSLTTAPSLPATTLAENCYASMFSGCTSLTTATELPATDLKSYCYQGMFSGCTSLTTLPKLPATTLTESCYVNMFRGCSKIKLSTTQTGEYQTAYRIPTSGTGTTATGWSNYMFTDTGGTFTSNPSINTTYYTSNTVV